jgi:hypothetical protein
LNEKNIKTSIKPKSWSGISMKGEEVSEKGHTVSWVISEE